VKAIYFTTWMVIFLKGKMNNNALKKMMAKTGTLLSKLRPVKLSLKRIRLDNVRLKDVSLGNPFKSVGMKIFATFFVSILFFVLLVGLVSYNISKTVIQNKVAEASVQTIVQAGEKMNLILSSYLELSTQIINDTSMDQLLVDLGAAERNKDTGKYEQLRQDIVDRLNVYLYSNPAILSIHLFSPKGTTIGSTDPIVNAANVSGKDWYKATIEQDGKPVWWEPSPKGFIDESSKSGTSYGLSRIQKSRARELQSVLFIELNPAILAKDLEKINMGVGGDAIIVNSQNKLVLTKEATKKTGENSSYPLPEEAFKQKSGSITDSNSNMQLAYGKLETTGWYLVGGMRVEELVKDANAIRNMTWVMAFIAMIIAVVIGFFVARMIGRPIVTIRNLMKEGEQGNLKVRTNITSQDEIGQLGQSFNQMMEKITQLVLQTSLSAQEVLATSSELSDASKKTELSAKEIAVATEEIANGASSLAVESEKGNELTSQIGVQMKAVVQSNVEMGTAASEVYKSSEQGIQYMSELIAKTNKTEQMTRDMVEKVDKLKESTRSIRRILDMLNNITKQTNILSLNATIEAARAGAAGKGFMVVADEIRKLADQSRQSIEVVGEITETIQREIDETVGVLSTAYPIFKEQIDSVKEADEIFKQVQEQMGGFISRLEGVTDSIQKLDQSQLVLSEAMSNVSAVAQESSATSEQVASLSSEQLNISTGLVKLSEKLEELSNSLKESLSKFQV
jgi:methyl-accepting chemotaxis protein